MEITLSDGATIKVEKLGLFELDAIKPEPMGAFTYKTNILGKEYDVIFDLEQWATPPVKPKTPESEILENSDEWYQLNDWKLYQAAMAHEDRRRDQNVKFVKDVAQYLVSKLGEDANHIKTPEDWEAVYRAMLVTPVTVDMIADTLKRTYKAQFDGMDVLEALEGLGDDNKGSYDTLRIWENQLMIEMQMTEVQYVLLPVEERARKICALFLPDIMQALESDRKMKEEKKRGKKS